ncbi:unnamed protein product [Clavelina lepadiformis]|uniref:Uncharacterized protein n=1 Tax=Clavelina lepadiformis TaxID=159417 RepID=A0ABP0G762_CLALP
MSAWSSLFTRQQNHRPSCTKILHQVLPKVWNNQKIKLDFGEEALSQTQINQTKPSFNLHNGSIWNHQSPKKQDKFAER